MHTLMITAQYTQVIHARISKHLQWFTLYTLVYPLFSESPCKRVSGSPCRYHYYFISRNFTLISLFGRILTGQTCCVVWTHYFETRVVFVHNTARHICHHSLLDLLTVQWQLYISNYFEVVYIYMFWASVYVCSPRLSAGYWALDQLWSEKPPPVIIHPINTVLRGPGTDTH